jgi:hypothetical protein
MSIVYQENIGMIVIFLVCVSITFDRYLYVAIQRLFIVPLHTVTALYYWAYDIHLEVQYLIYF